MAHFRVDRLSGIKILPAGFTPDEGFDVAGYTNKIVDMFAADRTISVELLCENKLMKTIIPLLFLTPALGNMKKSW